MPRSELPDGVRIFRKGCLSRDQDRAANDHPNAG